MLTKTFVTLVQVCHVQNLLILCFDGQVYRNNLSSFFEQYRLSEGGVSELNELKQISDLRGIEFIIAPKTLEQSLTGWCFMALSVNPRHINPSYRRDIGMYYRGARSTCIVLRRPGIGGWCVDGNFTPANLCGWHVSGPVDELAYQRFVQLFRTTPEGITLPVRRVVAPDSQRTGSYAKARSQKIAR